MTTHTTAVHRLTLAPVQFAFAQDFYMRYEHLGNCGLGVWHWGAFDAGHLIGVVSFGTTCFSNSRGRLSRIAAESGLHTFQICRGGTIPTAPHNTPSHVLSCALAELRRARGDCLVVAYADRTFNEVGTIYQACNALYTGETDAKNQSNYVINGRTMSGWVVRKKFGTRSLEALRRVDKDAIKIPLTKKYRYVFVLTSRLKRAGLVKILKPMLLPYPNREQEHIGPMDIRDLIHHNQQRRRSCTAF